MNQTRTYIYMDRYCRWITYLFCMIIGAWVGVTWYKESDSVINSYETIIYLVYLFVMFSVVGYIHSLRYSNVGIFKLKKYFGISIRNSLVGIMVRIIMDTAISMTIALTSYGISILIQTITSHISSQEKTDMHGGIHWHNIGIYNTY